MKLDSARELKQILTERLLRESGPMARGRAVLGEAAQSVSAASPTPVTMALGVARRKANDFQLAVRVQARALQGGREVDLITRQAKGEVEVRYVGAIRKRIPWQQQRQLPLRAGLSVGHFKVTAGTLGTFVRPRGGGPLAMLSNNHVLANENRAEAGDTILQPGAHDGGEDPDDAVAALGDFVKLKKLGPNLVDAACAKVNDGIECDPLKLTGHGKLKGVGDVFVDEGIRVTKIGRTTGATRGRVTAFELDNVGVEFGIGSIRFNQQIEVEGEGDGPFSDGGDSGSLIFGEDKRGVALLFAGSDQGGANGQGFTYANPLPAVLAALKIELAL